jgi:hypothetical protein
MAACSEWHAALLDHAAGGEAVEGLVEHVSGCTRCAEALTVWRERADLLDRSLGTLLTGKEPTAGFDRRVVAAARGQRAVPRHKWWAAAAAAAATLLLAVILVPEWVKHGEEQTPWDGAATIASWRSPTEFLLAPPLDGATLGTPRFGEFYLELEPMTGSVGDDDEKQ